MSLSRRLSLTSLTALALAAMGCQSLPLSTTASTSSAPASSIAPSASSTPAPLPMGALNGNITVPVIAAGGANVVAVGGANVIAAGGANVIAVGGANVIAAGGANVIAPGGANVIAPGGANYRIAALDPEAELPVIGAVAYLRDAVTRKRLDWVQPVLTDAKGHFHFDNLPAGINYLVEVDFITTNDHKPFRLLSLAQDGQRVTVDARTTMVAAAEVPPAANATQATGLYVADLSTQTTSVTELRKGLQALSTFNREAALIKAITMNPSELAAARGASGNGLLDPQALAALQQTLRSAGANPNGVATLPIPEVLADPSISAAGDACESVETQDPPLEQDLQAVKTQSQAPTSSATQAIVTAASQLSQLTTAPAAASSASTGGADTGTTASTSSGGSGGTSASVGSNASGSTTGGTGTTVSVGSSGVSVGSTTSTGTSTAGTSGGTATSSTSSGTGATVGVGGTSTGVSVGSTGSTGTSSSGTSAGTSSGGTATSLNVAAGSTSTSSSGTSTSTSGTSGSTGTSSTSSGTGASVGVSTGSSGTSATAGVSGTSVGIRLP